ncbi:type II and III secretion system protein family protein [Caulobacter sp. NIBR1757]|uniref:type II and III secretion system protein family protein n=1 Tax=Caulobacter sp. NIBR1757 TaxID=3016000 RepID=UPI0022F03E86|nr:type II and III secretion system protein family protein [Caulobacter sp. NIBR1757]WGM40462.1 Type 3 secretion system secretin [Caulobacter sp. NIBR1757]
MSRLRMIPALLAAWCLALGGPMASAQGPSSGYLAGGPAPAPTYDAPGSLRIDLAAGGAQTLSLPRGKSAIVELPVDARDVLVTNPAVADAMLRTPRRIYILGVASGQTDAVFFDAQGRRILSLNVRVDQDISALADTINRVLPGSKVIIEPIGDSIILSGLVLTPSDANKAGEIAKRFVAKPEQVVNMVQVAGSDQVQLMVRVVEVNRNVVKQLGFDLGAVIGQLGEDQLSIASTATFGINGALLGGMAGGYVKDTTLGGTTPGSSDVNSANATIKAFERVGLVRTLAQPVLTSVNGEPANFLAGGEFPVPVGQDSDGRVTIEFKKYGVGLGFTPVVMSGGRINMKVSVEVSELSNEGAFSMSTGSDASLVIPGLKVRRAENVVELPSGGTMMIAGLLQERTAQNLDSLPGFMNSPVLGALFRSRDFTSGQTELVIMVTPYIVDSRGSKAFQTPADGLQLASDPETILLGRLNKAVGAPPNANAGRRYQGPIGYVIE